MTVTYSAEVATSRGFGCFWKLLFRWRGSVYKLVWPDLVLFCGLYASLSFVYRVTLKEEHKRYFEKISLYCESFVNLIPIAFVLGFYVSIVVTRWWDQYMTIPWPDRMAIFVTANVHGLDDRGRLMRRTIMRYINLSLVMTLTCISSVVKKRFPTLDHLTEAGILLPNEKLILEKIKTPHPKYWMPIVWCTSLVTRARKEGRIRDDFALKTLLDEINTFRGGCGGLFNYDWISIPLVYTQVVTLAVYTFFMSCLFGRQFLDPKQRYPSHTIDLYIPIFTLLQYLFYMGWLKVAESLVNPFGEDDDDFEMNWLVDRNLQVSYLIVDEMHLEHPELIKDQYWDEIMPELPYTAAAEQFKTEPHMGSAAKILVPEHEAGFINLNSVIEEDAEEDKDDLADELVSSTPTETHPMRILLNRQLSGSSHGSSHVGSSRMTNRPSMLSMLQRMFSRTRRTSNSLSGSQVSLKRPPMRSVSKISYASQSPTLSHPEQDDIFKMSDLSINVNKNDNDDHEGNTHLHNQIMDILEKEHRSRKKKYPGQADSKTKICNKISSELNTNQTYSPQNERASKKQHSEDDSSQNAPIITTPPFDRKLKPKHLVKDINQIYSTQEESIDSEKNSHRTENESLQGIMVISTPPFDRKLKPKKPDKLSLEPKSSTSPLISPSDLQTSSAPNSPFELGTGSCSTSPLMFSFKKKAANITSPLARNSSSSNLTNNSCIHQEVPSGNMSEEGTPQFIPGLNVLQEEKQLNDLDQNYLQLPLKKQKQESTSFTELSTILEGGSPDPDLSYSFRQVASSGETFLCLPSNTSQRSHSIPNWSDHEQLSSPIEAQTKSSRQRTISEGAALPSKSRSSRFFFFKKHL